jgi:hypothetical protein
MTMIEWNLYRKNQLEPNESGIYLVTDGSSVEVVIFDDTYNNDHTKEFQLPDIRSIGDESQITHYAEINVPTEKVFKFYYGEINFHVLQHEILNHLQDLGVEQSFSPSETGIELIFVGMTVGEQANFDSNIYENINVQRIK